MPTPDDEIPEVEPLEPSPVELPQHEEPPPPPPESQVMGKAVSSVGVAGLAPLPKWLDNDGNGLADWQEPPALIKAMGFFTGLITSFVPSNTVTYRYADFFKQNVLPRLEAASKGNR